jgi:hypothetical protein
VRRAGASHSKHSLLAVAALALVAGACRGTSPGADGPALGEAGGDARLFAGPNPALHDRATLDAAFGIARRVLYAEPVPDSESTGAAALALLPGRRVFLCAYVLGEKEKVKSHCASGAGEDLAGSVDKAADALKESAAATVNATNAARIRLKLDVATRVEEATFSRSLEKPRARDVGAYGFWVESGGESSWILPSEVLEIPLHSESKGKKGIDRKGVLKALARRNDQLGELPEEFPYLRLRTVAWAESDNPDGKRPGIFRLYRLHAAEPEEISEDRLLQRAVWAADYLISSISSEGKVRYQYKVQADKDSASYNLLRHGGTTYSVFQVYDRTKFEAYRRAGDAAISYLLKHSRREERMGRWGGGDSLFVVEGDDIKLGGAGLALVMLVQRMESTGDREEYLDEARAYARFLLSQQKEDGEFSYFAPLKPGGYASKDSSEYYPGEAILGLIRLYALDRNELWLQTAVRGADWLIDVRDKGKSEAQLLNDHWLMLGLSYLHHFTKAQKYLEHSFALGRAVEHQYRKNLETAEEHPDYRGGYYDPPRSTPAAVRAEGLGAVLDLCASAGRTDCAWVEELLLETVRHEIWSQYDPDQIFWVKNRKKSFGGWNGGLMDMSIRNDFVQHNMSAVLETERQLRRKKGETVPGGPLWTDRWLAGERFPGVEAEKMAELRAATMRFRGPGIWDGPGDGGAAAEQAGGGGTPLPKDDDSAEDAEDPVD